MNFPKFEESPATFRLILTSGGIDVYSPSYEYMFSIENPDELYENLYAHMCGTHWSQTRGTPN